MALRINTNVAALNSHKNLISTDNKMQSSLEKLSSGLRINRAADDASGMAIADSLRSQALGLGQAIRNGNDGISIVQTADAALEESINIVNTIKQKSIQAAQDGQTTESRKAIQADISKLREELDNIAKTTSFNNQKLLSGNFADKKFQIGAYAGETIDISIQSTEANKIGHITTSNLSFGGAGTTELNVYSNLLDKSFSLNSIELAFNNNAENGVGAVADAINKLSDELGISATASVDISTNDNITAGTTGSGFSINGVTIGSLTVKENDSDGALVSAINNKTSEHGVTASVDQSGVLTLASTDNRAISVSMDDATKAIMGGTDSLSTLGKVEVRQEGTSQITITDANAGDGVAISTVGGSITVDSGATASTQESIAADGSRLIDTTLGSGTTIAGTMTTKADIDLAAANDDIAAKGSTIAKGSEIGSGTTLQGNFTVNAASNATDAESTIAAGSQLASGSSVAAGSKFKGDVSASLSGVAGASIKVSGTGDDMYTIVETGSGTVKAGSTLTLTAEGTLGTGSIVQEDSVLKAGTTLEAEFVTKEDTTITGDMELQSGSKIATGSILTTGSVMNADQVEVSDGRVSGTMTLAKNTTLGENTVLTDGSTIGGETTLKNDITVGLDGDMLLGSGSTIKAGSTIAAGTYLTNDIEDENGVTFKKGTTLESDIVVGSTDEVLSSGSMIVAGGSILKAGTKLAVNDASSAANTSSSLSDTKAYRLSDVDVTTQEGAQIGIAVADAALKSLDKVRSDLGSVQNQLSSTISNISTTRVNVFSAESTIRDVDFAEESSNFTKMQILSQAGSFAMSQANASSQQVLSLLG